PNVITEVTAIPAIEKWHGRPEDISRKVTKIQHTGLSDYQIRDLNDEINKRTRENHVWEVQLRNPGRPKNIRSSPKAYSEGGVSNKYFDHARELPRAKWLFDELKASTRRRNSRHCSGKR
ncbi:Isy1-like splicing factor, partial [Tuber borchii]